jgi:hypothetical protein
MRIKTLVQTSYSLDGSLSSSFSCWFAKVRVAGSNPVVRSEKSPAQCGVSVVDLSLLTPPTSRESVKVRLSFVCDWV